MATTTQRGKTVSSLLDSYPLLLTGAMTTLYIWLCTILISCVTGVLFGLLRSKPLRVPVLSTALDGITMILRGVPFYVQLLIYYFALPELLPINLTALHAGVFSLGLCSAAFVSQIICGGIQALGKNPWEACYVLGYSTPQTLRKVILPQTFRVVLPMMIGEMDQLLKSTAIISSLGVLELTRAGINIINSEMNPIPVYGAMALIYLILSFALNAGGSLLQRKYHVPL